jgi:hypothetical protein
MIIGVYLLYETVFQSIKYTGENTTDCISHAKSITGGNPSNHLRENHATLKIRLLPFPDLVISAVIIGT